MLAVAEAQRYIDAARANPANGFPVPVRALCFKSFNEFVKVHGETGDVGRAKAAAKAVSVPGGMKWVLRRVDVATCKLLEALGPTPVLKQLGAKARGILEGSA